MWKIGEVKRKGNWAFKKNYWKTVIVAFIFSLIVGGGVGTFNYSTGSNPFKNWSNSSNSHSYSSYEEFNDAFGNDAFGNDAFGNDAFGNDAFGNFSEDDLSDVIGDIDASDIGVGVAAVLVGAMVFFIIFVIIVALALALDILVYNPVTVGTKNFYLKNINTNADVKEMFSAFDKGSYKNMIKVVFFKDLYTFLWSLLFIIPGIVKAYEYRMIPYLMAENPEMSKEQAFYESKRMMTGNKWHAFLLDLSFIGWYILTGLTLGILGIFYVSPYKHSTDAVLYETLKYGNGNVVYSDQAETTMN